MTKRPVILNAKRERIRIPLERETDCHAPNGARNDRTIAYCTHLTAFVAIKRFVILSDVTFAAVQEKASNGGRRKSEQGARQSVPP